MKTAVMLALPALSLSLCLAQAASASCTAVTLTPIDANDTALQVWTDFSFFGPKTTTGNLTLKQRTLSGDDCGSDTYLFAEPTSNSANPNGAGIAARVGGGDTLAYQLLRSSSSADAWGNLRSIGGDACNCIAAPAHATSPLATFYVAARDGARSALAGTYTDTVTVTRRPSASSNAIATPLTMTVAIEVPSRCVFSSGAGNLEIHYTALSGGNSPSTSFQVDCNITPTGLSLDSASGSLLEIPYTLNLSHDTLAIGVFGGSIQATAEAGKPGRFQADKCLAYSQTGRCQDSQAHVLTISY